MAIIVADTQRAAGGNVIARNQAISSGSTVSGVVVSPATASGSTTFSAVVNGTGSPSQAVTWSTTAGSINASGVFTAPAQTASVQTITVTARSQQDGTYAGNATVTIAAAAGRRCTLLLTSNGTAPAVSRSGIRWAWYDASPPNLTALPAVTGTGATTSASGIFDVSLAGTTLLAAQVGTLLALISDGTPGSAGNRAFCAPVAVL